MQHLFRHRELESTFAGSVTSICFTSNGETLGQPDNHWDFVIFRRQDFVSAMCSGLTTKTVSVSHRAGDEILTVAFSPGTFMPALPGSLLKDGVSFLDMFGRREVRIGG